MQPFAGIADKRGETFLDIEMHIFQFQKPDEVTAADFVANSAQAGFDGSQIIRIDNARAREHPCVSKRTLDVIFRQSAVKANRCGITLHQFRDRLIAAGAEQLLLDRMLAHFIDKGLIKARGRQGTDSTHVLAAIRSRVV